VQRLATHRTRFSAHEEWSVIVPGAPPGGLVLGIETATVCGGVAVVSSTGELLGEISLRNQESHSERILPAAEWLLKTLGLSVQALSAVAVSSGPGSFTGLRAGIATAKGLAFSLGVPLFGIPTLDALVAHLPPEEGPVCAVLSARRGEVYRAFFHSGTAGAKRSGPDGLVTAASLAGEVPAGCLVVGELAALETADAGGSRSFRFAPSFLNHPRASAVAFLGGIALSESRDSEIATLVPRYLRPCDAVPCHPGRGQFVCTNEGLRGAALR
jgi:tRNA threonylcarbamoyladenosine biosynthesis protein TsaB